MRLYLPYPVNEMNEEEKKLWREIYYELGEPEGHTISASYKSICECRTCTEYLRRQKQKKEVNEMNRYSKKGVEVSQFCKWNGKNITRVYLDALTDSNFHTLRKKVAKLVNKELNSKLRLEG